LLSSPCHQKSHDERAVFLYGTSIPFFRHELGIAYFFGSERGIVRRFQRLFGDFVLISFRSYNGILSRVAITGEEVYTMEEVAEKLRVTPKTVREWIQRDESKAIDAGQGVQPH
jgi:excisionase family DNA binding protein